MGLSLQHELRARKLVEMRIAAGTLEAQTAASCQQDKQAAMAPQLPQWLS